MAKQQRRAVIYARKSKYVGDDQSKSVTDQLADGRAYAERKGWSVVAELKDDGKSGHTLPWQKRPDFARAVEIFERGEADTFVTLWTSRLSRDEEDRAALPRMLAALGVEWHAVEDGGLIETETYAGFMMDGFRRLIDVGESKRKSEMWKATHRRRVEAGLPKNGLPRFGYHRLLVDGKPGPYVPDPVTGPRLRDMYLRYTAGAGFQTLAKELNAEGVKTSRGGTWQVQTLLRALDSGFGAGKIIVAKRSSGREDEYRPGAHDAVITEDEWTAYLDARTARKQVAPRRKTAGWHLAGLAVCGRCGGRLIVTTYRDDVKSQALCSEYHGRRSCDGVWVKRQTLEHRVSIWLGGHLEDLPERTADSAGAENVVKGFEDALTAVQASLTRLATGYAEGLLDADGYRGAQAGLLDERRRTENAVRHAREELSRVAPLDRDVYSRLESPQEMSPGEWNSLLGKVLRRVEVHPDRMVMVPVVGEAAEFKRARIQKSAR